MPYASRGRAAALACAALACAVLACATFVAAPAQADQASAQACAKTLPPEAMAIYRDAAPEVTPGTDLRSLLKVRVKALVMGGSVQRATAHALAVAA